MQTGLDADIIALSTHQALVAAGSVVGSELSVSVSAVIPAALRPQKGWLPTSFRTITLNSSGTTRAAVRIAPASVRPQRVLVTPAALSVNTRITAAPQELDAFGADPNGAFAFDDETFVFVTAPNQALYATVDPGSAGRTLSVSTSEIVPLAPGGRVQRMGPARVKTIALPAPFEAVRIAPSTMNKWLRVTVFAFDDVAISATPAGLTTPPVFPNAFIPSATPGGTSFVLPPSQGLFAAALVGATSLQVSVSEALFDCCDYP